jgi:ribosomal subunit interface protein
VGLLQERFMPLRISGKNLDIGEALRQHINEKLESATSKYFDGSVSGHVVITPEGSGYYSDCTLHLASGVTLQAEGRAHDPYASFDQAAERIEKQLRRYKRRLKDHHPVGADNRERQP